MYSKSKSIVKLSSPKKGSGSGFFVTRKGYNYIMTNRHVCLINGGSSMEASYNGKKFLSDVLVYSKYTDLCLMTAPSNVKPLSLARSAKLKEQAFILGHPLGLPKTLEKGRLISNEIIELVISCDLPYDEKVKLPALYQMLFGVKEMCLKKFQSQRINAFTYPGNSGSPVLDVYGRVTGVVFAGSNNAPNAGYLIPLDIARSK